MGKILILNQETINQIAAGEVIERPASVVKELVENAIDAKATAITVEIREGGISFIRVTDNGSGFLKEDLPLAFLRHSTSKIRGVEDLAHIGSLGFRGEALSSIAAVAQVELLTCATGQTIGSRYRIEGGEEMALEEIGAPEGTTFLVRNLFFNTPVRRKFLKTPVTEGSYIGELMERMALSHPELSLRFIANGQIKLHTAGNHNLKDIIYSVFGRDITANLIPIEAKSAIVSVQGFIGKPLIARGNRSYEIYYINGRYIKSNILHKAIEDGYKGFLMQHKYPFVVLHFAIDPEYLDVNVHPTKMELRFRGEQELYQFLVTVVREALQGKELIPRVQLTANQKEEPKKAVDSVKKPAVARTLGPEPFEKKRMEAALPVSRPAAKPVSSAPFAAASVLRETPLYQTSAEVETRAEIEVKTKAEIEEKTEIGVKTKAETEEKTETEIKAGTKAKTEARPLDKVRTIVKKEPDAVKQEPKTSYTQPTLFEEKLISPQKRAQFRLIGQLFDTYWLVQVEKEFLIIDQHAAHEKVLYERTMKRLAAESIPAQQLAPPLVLTLSPLEIEIVTKNQALFERMGFSIEPFGGREYAVYSVPDHLYGIADRELLLQMIDELTQNGKAGVELLADRVATASCKAAVKGNNRLSFAEAEQLLSELLTLENPYTCPHGRPTIISMSQYELEKKFKRVL